MDISNKTLAFFLVAAMVVSIAGTMVSLNKIGDSSGITGYTPASGNVTLNVSKTASIVFMVGAVDWGSGTVNTDGDGCVMDTKTEGTSGCSAFSGDGPLELENDGNLDVSVAFNISGNETMIPSTDTSGRLFFINWTNNESTSCNGSNVGYIGDWVSLNSSMINNESLEFCANLTWADTVDAMDIHFNITLPINTYGGEIRYNITAIATSIE